MEGDTIEFDVLSLVAVHQSVPATQGKAEAGKLIVPTKKENSKVVLFVLYSGGMKPLLHLLIFTFVSIRTLKNLDKRQK